MVDFCIIVIKFFLPNKHQWHQWVFQSYYTHVIGVRCTRAILSPKEEQGIVSRMDEGYMFSEC